MAFDRQQSITPQRIGHITVTLVDPDPQQPSGNGLIALPQSATAEVHVVMSDGSDRVYRANVADHFSATVLNQLRTFVASVRSKAEAEVLP